MARFQQRVADLEVLLAQDDISIAKLRAACHQGIPDKKGLRSSCWRLLLRYLPCDRSSWASSLQKNRELYRTFVRECVVDTHQYAKGDPPATSTQGAASSAGFIDPLGALAEGADNPAAQQWDAYFKDNEVLDQIIKDVKRLAPDFAFFQAPTGRPRPEGVKPLHLRVQRDILESETIQHSRSGIPTMKKKTSTSSLASSTADDEEECHWEVVARLLFIYAKLNPGIAYVQGMNEILGPLYFVMASDPGDDWRANAEADTFFCFTAIMSEIRDSFIKTLDDSDIGIGSLMRRLMSMLQKFDPEVTRVLDEQQLKPQFFAFRWLTLLLCQEFALPELLRLWDSLFAAEDLVQYLLSICSSMVVNVRGALIEGEFADNMKLLQRFPEIDVHLILQQADKINDQENHEKRHRRFLQSGSVR